MTMKEYAHSCAEELKKLPTQKTVVKVCNKILHLLKYSLQGTTQGNGLTGGVPPVRFSM